jgi:regulator of protease activity HflC (stomatin/prohibitin superfamily)
MAFIVYNIGALQVAFYVIQHSGFIFWIAKKLKDFLVVFFSLSKNFKRSYNKFNILLLYVIILFDIKKMPKYDPNEDLVELHACAPEESMEEVPINERDLNKIEAKFDTIVTAKEVDRTENGFLDHVLLDDGLIKTYVPIETWKAGNFNFLDQTIERDDSNKVRNNLELIEKFNENKFEDENINGSGIGITFGYLASALTLGGWILMRRRTIPPGNYGHYISSSKHVLTAPGIRMIISTAESWKENILIDDEENPNRKIGDKVILQVPENHLAGGYRIGMQKGGSTKDQEFVLFSQGRHILPESRFYGVDIIKLTTSRMSLGPLTVLYVREGWLGGVVHRKTGVFRILYPGPPYILHEQDYENVQLVERVNDVFRVGPFEFVTVKDGQIAGAFSKLNGRFQILPPGKSYQLHQKDYSNVHLINRTKEFKLGPYYFLTVSSREEAGVYRKKDGLFVRLAAGKTYQLNEDSFEQPIIVKRKSHVTKCGPLTMLTVEEGTLNGAYRVSDGKFVEFEDQTQEYVLHEKGYHGLVTVSRNSNLVQFFGPFKVVTIREGFVGQFEIEGNIDIKQPGYYKVESNVNIYDPIPVRMFQEILPELEFRTKDGVSMGVKTTITWHVTNAQQVANFSGSFKQLQGLVKEMTGDALIRLCKMYNRGDLLPTAQDLDRYKQEGMSLTEVNKVSEEEFIKLQAGLADSCCTEMGGISTTSKLGITVLKVQIERFQLKNDSILIELESITKAQLSANRERAEGEYRIVKADLDKQARIKDAEANASVALAEAKAAADVRLTEIEMENRSRQDQATVDNTIAREKTATAMQIEYDKVIKEAESKSMAIRAITEAEYLKKIKECEAASHMPEQEFELRKLQLQVDMLREIGHAAWQYPDVYTGFLTQFGDKLRIGPLSVTETLSRLSAKESGVDAGGNMFNPLGSGTMATGRSKIGKGSSEVDE